MSERTRNLVLVAAMVALTAALVTLVSSGNGSEDRVEALGSRIRCPVCQGESIADSPAPMAQDMIDLIGERVAEGAEDEEIIDELLSSYSGAVLLDPPARDVTLPLWLAPPAALLLGLAVIVWWRSHPGPSVPHRPPPARSRARVITGALILVGALAGVVAVAAASLQDRPAPAAGVADLEGRDLSQVSNETMEAVIAANQDNPQINGMRLALAERYFAASDYRAAFPHYLAVAEDPEADDRQVVTALARLGWMAYDGNGEVEAATRLLEQALAIDPVSDLARYAYARVRWCGAGDVSAALPLLEELANDSSLPEESRRRVSEDLAAARAGEGCA